MSFDQLFTTTFRESRLNSENKNENMPIMHITLKLKGYFNGTN